MGDILTGLGEAGVAGSSVVTGLALLGTPAAPVGLVMVVGGAILVAMSASRMTEGIENVYFAASDTDEVGINLLREAVPEDYRDLYDFVEFADSMGLASLCVMYGPYVPQDNSPTHGQVTGGYDNSEPESISGVDSDWSANAEVYYRTMSPEDFDYLRMTGELRATTETMISPTYSFSSDYDGVTVEFSVKAGTTQSLLEIGVGNNTAQAIRDYGMLPQVSKGWNENHAFFKGEGLQTNIGLGQGKALEIFNSNIISFKQVGGI